MPGESLCLAIETSNPSADPSAPGEVALARSADWRSPSLPFEMLVRETLSPKARHDDALMPAIDRLFAAVGCRPRRVSRIAVSIGPGGYSALRIAVATARMIAEATGAACVPVNTAGVASLAPGLPDRFVVLLASKRDTAWATTFARAAEGGVPLPTAPGGLVDAAGLSMRSGGSLIGAIVADGHLPDVFRARAQAEGVPVVPLRLGAGPLLEASRGLEGVSADALAPLYPREAEAVRKWRELGRAKQP